MEWREQSSVSCEEAYFEAQRWIEAVTEQKFGNNDFRSALENGIRLCELINKIKPGTIRRVNRLPTPIAGLDNLNVFLKACGKLGLKEAQLFHPGDLQDLSTRVTVKHQETNRRLKNVLITIFWLGRRAQFDRLYNGPYLNLKAFEGLLGTALYKALQESDGQKGNSIRDSGFGDSWCSEREELHHLRGGGGESGGHRRDDSLDSLDSVGSRPHSISSDTTLKGSSEGCCSDTKADSIFKMANNQNNISYRRSLVITPKASTQFNQFLPSKDKPSGYVPAPLRKKRAERSEDSRRSLSTLSYAENEGPLTSHSTQSAVPAAHYQWGYDCGSDSDSDADRPDPDLVLDDLASRRFHSLSPAPPTNFAMPISPSAGAGVAWVKPGSKVSVSPRVAPQQNMTFDSRSWKTQSPMHSSVKVDHHRAVNTDSLFRDMYDDDSEEDDDEVGYADPVQDDLYARKIGVNPQPVSSVSYNKFLPKFWTPEEDDHIQKIKLGSQRRPWYKKMQGFSSRQKSGSSSDDSECDISPWLSSAPSPHGPPPSHAHTHEASAQTTLVDGKRELQTQESMDGSKSTSDILEDAPVLHQNRFEELQKYREQIKRSEDRWQDDLSKWKNRRRSVNSDIVKKKEEREKIEQITYGADRGSKSFKDVQEERENKGRSSIGSRLGSLSFLGDSEEVFDAPVVSLFTRNRLPRSSTIDTPYHSSEYSRRAEEPPPASLPTLRAASPPTAQEAEAVDSPAASSPTIITPINHISVTKSSPPADAPEHKSQAKEHAIKTEEATSVVSSSSSTQEEPEPEPLLLGAQTKVEAPSSGSLQKKPPQFSSMEPKPPGVSQVSASLPRSYQISNGARLTSVVTPRPFGSQSSRIASLPRAYTVDDTSKRVNGNVDVSKKASVPSRYQQFMTSEDEALSSSAHSSEEEEEEEKTKSESSTSNPSVSSASSDVKTEAPVSSAPAKETSKKNFCDMRISLNQKPNSSRDFGFHAAWDSTGARVTSIQPGSPAEMCQLQVGDEVLMVNGHKVAEMSYTAWKSCMEEALQEGSLVMDVRRHGQNNWDRDQPSLPFKSHKTINLTSTDHPILLGTPETKTVSSSLDFTSLSFTETGPAKDAPTPLLVDVASNRVNGNLQEESVTMRNKESEPMSLKNLKRRSEFFEQGDSGSSVSALVFLCGKRGYVRSDLLTSGGSESTVPDIPVPVITPSSSRWSWDPEEERRRQEKWQKEQERLLQEKYRRDQEKLQEEWLKAQQEISTSVGQQEPGSLQVNSHSIRPRSPPSSAHRPTPLWEEEEQKGKLEEERQRQEQERRKREEEERELQRLQEERRRKEMQEEEERMRKEEEELRWQRRREEEREEERRRQEAVEQQRRARFLEQQWSGTSHGFDSVQHPLSFTDRARSQSSPQLDEEDKPQQGGAHEQPEGATQWLQREKLRIARDRQAQSLRIVMEWEMRNESKRAVTGAGVTEKKAQLPSSQAEADRQQILNEMKKKTPLLTDGSWIRQRSASTVNSKDSDVPPMRRGESLDNLDASSNSWHSSSRTPRSSSFAQNYSRPQSALYSNTSFYTGGSGAPRPVSSTLPSSHSTGSLRGWTGTNSSPWSQPSPSLSTPPPITSPDPISEAGAPQQQSRSVSGKKICTFCDTPLGKGAAMIIESLGLCYHLGCFKCIDCKCDLGGSKAGAEVRIRNKQLYCNSCYVRFKSGQPTSI
ncbi:LIM domain only protein 7 isoform X4 [Nothobranchius furzeri]|uniref:LIM domain only protein 7 isoform X4 n=1 Tax=Nothobranchius furzeri TaxID=105023 RepID=UPI003904C550